VHELAWLNVLVAAVAALVGRSYYEECTESAAAAEVVLYLGDRLQLRCVVGNCMQRYLVMHNWVVSDSVPRADFDFELHSFVADNFGQSKFEVHSLVAHSFVVHELSTNKSVVQNCSPAVSCIDLTCRVLDRVQVAHSRKVLEVHENERGLVVAVVP